MRKLADMFQIDMLSTVAESPWSNGVYEKRVRIIKKGLQKVKEEKDTSRNMTIMWIVVVKMVLD